MVPGPDRKLTVDQVIRIMKESDRPFWSAQQFSERADVSKATANDRLKEADRKEAIASLKAGNSSIYYLPGKQMKRFGEDTDPIKADLRGYWTDRFVGDPQRPAMVTTLHNSELTTGDRVKFLVMGRPGNWDLYESTAIDESVGWIEPPGGEWYTAIITGELIEKPTVPIEHMDYPGDYDLELNTGGEYLENGNLIAAGVKNYLIKPCNDALFLQDVTVERLEGPGPEMNEVETVHAPYQREKKYPTKVWENPSKYLSEEQE